MVFGRTLNSRVGWTRIGTLSIGDVLVLSRERTRVA